ncbi:MAG: hypothetical protein COA67_01455 [Lutibacter sp.]|nr:MAG: hypothetical protein COA67_01455 [Lutibacter sp.]
MKIVISPAKSLDFESKAPTSLHTSSIFLQEAAKLNTVLKKKSVKKLAELMHISTNLGQLNYERNQEWNLPFSLENAKQAIYAFTGDVYRGLDVDSISQEKMPQLQDKLRILSGQYGILKPLDLIQAYRLEMSTKLKVGRKDTLYQFWGSTITNALNNEMTDDELFVNLASNEYFKVIKPKELKVPIITPIFKEYKNGAYKTIAIFAKLARGSMTRYIIQNNIETVEGIKGFNTDKYRFDSKLSTEKELVFTR